MKSRVGLKLTKFHSLLYMGFFIQEYGSPLKFFDRHLEEFLKHFVKNCTQEKVDSIEDIYMTCHLVFKNYNV